MNIPCIVLALLVALAVLVALVMLGSAGALEMR